MERITDFRILLSGTLSRKIIDRIVVSVSNHPEDFTPLFELTNDYDTKISWRATWACEKLCKIYPEWFTPLYEQLIQNVLKCNYDGIKRLWLSVLYQLPVTTEFPVTLYDFCINHMLSPGESIAVQAICMKLAYKLCMQERELLYELEVYLENAEPEYYSAGVRNTRKNILKNINLLHKKR
ncbi:hypothetical protein [Coprobacter sp.]